MSTTIAPGDSVHVGMPVYNSIGCLPIAIDSILGQSHRNLRLIICDNASDDGSFELCQEIARRDERVSVYRNPTNIGITANFNRTFELSNAPYFLWASSNDCFAPNMVERCLRTLRERPDVVLCFGGTRFFESDPVHAVDYPEDLDLQAESPTARFIAVLQRLRINNALHGLVRSSVLRHTALQLPHFSSDMVLIAELALHGKFVQLPEVLFYRRMDKAGSTLDMNESQLLKYWGPGTQSGRAGDIWRMQLAFLQAVWRAPLSWRERYLTTTYCFKGAYWSMANPRQRPVLP
ncbi:MAG TPA: glycosyltransferase family 2 protein [Steroidobacteraceae bacterium]|nr:glycosyltransferase family 2 protein [Steroidobacteraceae bacterium]